jgi:REP element-mobilizing transposase RayT
METRPYHLDELAFAYCYHAYLHWRTHRRKHYPALGTLNCAILHALVEPLGIYVLECSSQAAETRVLASLRPTESVSACASKLKGRTSKWLRERLGAADPANLLARGYFACTAGSTTAPKLAAYLDAQGTHHGYSNRLMPRVFVQTYHPEREPHPWWHADHACTHLQFHIVLATAGRRGLFGAVEAAAVAAGWLELQREHQFALRKVSFVPDHVHLALLLHPAAAPAERVVTVMNAAQRVLAEQFPNELVRAKLPRVWQPSRYLGSLGELATPQVQKYLERWQSLE